MAKVALRAWTPGDVAACAALANNAEVHRYMRDAFPYPYAEADAVAFIERAGDPLADGADPRGSGQAALAIVDADTEAVMGGIGVHFDTDIRTHCAEIGYWVGEPYWRRGVATQAVGLMLPLATARWGVLRFEATVFALNSASIAVLVKNGFRVEGERIRRAYCKNGAFHDGVALAFVTPELQRRRVAEGEPAQDAPRKGLAGIAKLAPGAVSLRPYMSSDLDEVHRLADDPEVHRYTSNRFPYPFTREEAQAYMEKAMSDSPTVSSFAVLVEGRLAGGCIVRRLADIESHVGFIGYWLGTEFSGRGAATQLIPLIVAEARRLRGSPAIRKLTAYVMTPNIASATVLKKNGFELEDSIACDCDKNGVLYDEFRFSRLLD